MDQSPWNGLNVINDEIQNNRRTFEGLNRDYSEGPRTETPRREITPFNDDYDFVRYQDRITSNENLKGLNNPRLAKGVIALGISFTLVLGGSCAGSVIADKFSNLFKGEEIEEPVGTVYASKEAYEAGLSTAQTMEMTAQDQEAQRIFDKIANEGKESLTEEELEIIKAYPEDQFGRVNIPESENVEVNNFKGGKAM